MYAAYQSHQSCGGATASNAPWRSEVSCRRSARAATSISLVPRPAGKPLRDLLQQPAVAVGVAERGVREVRPVACVSAPRRPRFVHLTDVDAAADERLAGGIDVFDGED